MNEYERVWEQFVSEEKLEHGGHTDPEWRDGHEISVAMLVPVEAAPLLERLAPLREELDAFPFVSVHPDHFLHITVLILGFLSETPRDDKEISPRKLTSIEHDARQALADFPPFTVKLENLNAFPAAAFVEVHDGGMLEELREALRSGCGLKVPKGPPHLTIAYFEAPDDSSLPQALVRRIERYRTWYVGEATVRNIHIASLNLTSRYPRLETLAEIPLNGRTDG